MYEYKSAFIHSIKTKIKRISNHFQNSVIYELESAVKENFISEEEKNALLTINPIDLEKLKEINNSIGLSERTCKRCGKTKPESQFLYKYHRKGNYIENLCLDCNRLKQQEYSIKRKIFADRNKAKRMSMSNPAQGG